MRYVYFEYQVIPFGFLNISVSFQGYINKILIEKLDLFVIIHLNDILIYTNKIDSVDAVCWIFDKLRKHFLYNDLKKHCFHQEEGKFLGYVVFLQDVCIKNNRIKAICDQPQPQSIQNIQEFLKFANFYQQLILDFSWIAALLASMLGITSGSLVNELISIEDHINGVGGDKVIIEVNSKGSEMEFVIPELDQLLQS